MINIISGTTAVTLSPNNTASKGVKKANTSAGSSAETSAQVQNTQSSQQSAAMENMQAQVQKENTQSIEFTKDAIRDLQRNIRKEYIDRNHYVDKDTNVPVLQIVNNDTGRVVVQYPADTYLNLIMKVRENQKLMINQKF